MSRNLSLLLALLLVPCLFTEPSLTIGKTIQVRIPIFCEQALADPSVHAVDSLTRARESIMRLEKPSQQITESLSNAPGSRRRLKKRFTLEVQPHTTPVVKSSTARKARRSFIQVKRLIKYTANLTQEEWDELEPSGREVVQLILKGLSSHEEISSVTGRSLVASRDLLVRAVDVLEGIHWRHAKGESINLEALSGAERTALNAIALGYGQKELGYKAKEHISRIRAKSGLRAKDLGGQDKRGVVGLIRRLAHNAGLLPQEQRPSKEFLDSIENVVYTFKTPIHRKIFIALSHDWLNQEVANHLNVSRPIIVSGVEFIDAIIKTDSAIKRYAKNYNISARVCAFLLLFYRPTSPLFTPSVSPDRAA